MSRRRVTVAVVAIALLASGCSTGPSGDGPRPSADELMARAEAGDTDALFDLGARYANGDGVGRDNVTAYMWFELAAELARSERRYEARRMQLVLDPEMFRHQIAEAERLARLWKEAHRGERR